MSDEAVGLVIGERLKKLRLGANITQEEIVERAGMSRQTLVNLESHGKGTLATLIAVLRAINALDRLASLLEDVRPSPIKVAQMGGRVRTRASSIGHARDTKSSNVTISNVKVPAPGKHRSSKGEDW